MQPILVNFLYKNRYKKKDNTNNSFKDNNIFDKNKIIEPSNEYIKKELDYNPFFLSF